ncbi:sucrose-phosphate synthase 2 [Populus alba x Populus x berolinensis]|uniref:Sucrose-phosphate synthase 2 n=1 Tax=Populus alba x Populus x berolinensis TaxID=444605 RepID=A0AAD6WG58_9ROSI|nr:sucrose-phosphate synthase 2 [Populus alba x Populus x berolinensis]
MQKQCIDSIGGSILYLFVRWRLNVANMFVILGENGDTDYEEMISGAHKTIILKDVATKGSEDLLRATDLRDDIVPKESPLIAYLSGKATASEIADVLKQVSKASAGM